MNTWGFTKTEAVDIHCHCLPGLDDGPRTSAEALLLCRALARDGITTVIATPHQMGRYDLQNSPDKIRAAVASLQTALDAEQIPLQVKPGADVRVDERTLNLLAGDRISTLADLGRHILLELPHETLIDLSELLVRLLSRQVTGIITHPERHHLLRQRIDLLAAWSKLGAAIQVTAASLLGHAGPAAYESAWELAEAGLIDLVASDAHDVVRRPPCMAAAARKLVERFGTPVARRICLENPLAVLNGRPVRSLRRTTLVGGRL